MSNSKQFPSVVSRGLWADGDQSIAYIPAPLRVVTIRHHTRHKVYIQAGSGSGRAVDQHRVWCPPDIAAEQAALANYEALKAALAALSGLLSRLQPYMTRCGPFKNGMPLLCSTVIVAPEAGEKVYLPTPWGVPKVERVKLLDHHAQRLSIEGMYGGPAGARGKFYCPDDDQPSIAAGLPTWAEVEAAAVDARARLDALNARLRAFGTYDHAVNRFRREGSPQQPQITGLAT